MQQAVRGWQERRQEEEVVVEEEEVMARGVWRLTQSR